MNDPRIQKILKQLAEIMDFEIDEQMSKAITDCLIECREFVFLGTLHAERLRFSHAAKKFIAALAATELISRTFIN